MLALAVLLAGAAPIVDAPARATIVSAAASRVALTVYRDPSRGRRQAMSLRWLGGFALITETRTIAVPAGDAVLRFEGVADGIIPASAIVTGLPGGVIEKNRDARLLSPAALIDGTLGRDVLLRRTDRRTGRISEEQARIVAGPADGVVLETQSGIETLRCAGLPDRLAYRGVPPGLSAKPVLSVTTRSVRAARVTVTLSYLAAGFDWSASYVATVAPEGGALDLFAWLTLANRNAQRWKTVQLQAVAGRVQRRNVREIAAAAAGLELHCYPLGTTTSDLPTIEAYRRDPANDIVVTASRAFAPLALMAPAAAPPPPPPPPEDLGDLKLYRLPETVDVAANGQKQVALLARQHVAFDTVHRFHFLAWRAQPATAATIALRLHNDEKAGLGIALPAGTTNLYAARGPASLLLGTGTIGDTAIGEKLLLTAGSSTQVEAEQRQLGQHRHVTVSNANAFPVAVEILLGTAGEASYVDATMPLDRIDGIQTWRVTVPANASLALDYGVPKR